MRKIIRMTALLVMGASLSACGGGGGSGNTFKVESYKPAAHERTNVKLEVGISATFSEPVGTTQPAGAFVLQGPAGAIAGELGLSGSEASFEPQTPLALRASYTAMLSADFANADGRTLDAPFNWEFDTREGVWRVEQIDSADTRYVRDERIGIDAAGNAVAAWVGDNSDEPKALFASFYSISEGTWSQAKQIFEVPETDFITPALSVGSNGHAVLAWAHNRGDKTYASVYAPGDDGFSAPEELDTDHGSAAPSVGVDAKGNALAIWGWHGSGAGRLSVRRFDAESKSWGAAEQIEEPNPTGGVRSPQLVMNAAGDGLLVWARSALAEDVKIFARYYSAQGWSAATQIGEPTVPSGMTHNLRAALDSKGRGAVLIGYQDITGKPSNHMLIHAVHFTEDHTWSAPVVLADGALFEPQLTLSDTGTALASWEMLNADGKRELNTKRRDPDAGWDVQVQAHGLVRSYTNQALMDAAGNATLLWESGKPDGSTSRSRRLLADGAWEAEEERREYNHGGAAAMNAGGRLVHAAEKMMSKGKLSAGHFE